MHVPKQKLFPFAPVNTVPVASSLYRTLVPIIDNYRIADGRKENKISICLTSAEPCFARRVFLSVYYRAFMMNRSALVLNKTCLSPSLSHRSVGSNLHGSIDCDYTTLIFHKESGNCKNFRISYIGVPMESRDTKTKGRFGDLALICVLG